MKIEEIVLEQYEKRLIDPTAVLGNESGQLCCSESYDENLLKQIPKEIVENDFGCGNPSKYVRSGDVVLDLGSGSGKTCYLLSQIVGPSGRVIGVDINQKMLTLANAHKEAFARQIGYNNMHFARARIQDLRTDLDHLEKTLSASPIRSLSDLTNFQYEVSQKADTDPVVADNSVDIIVSNCVINLVDTAQKTNVFKEMFRVLKRGGRIAISDNVSNIPVPETIKSDPALWAGCYAGVFQEQDFYKQLEAAGFTALKIEVRRNIPDRKIGDVEFHSVTVTAGKPDEQHSDSQNDLCHLMYRGPWAAVEDEAGKRFKRGELVTVSAGRLRSLAKETTFRDELFFIESDSTFESTEKPAGCC